MVSQMNTRFCFWVTFMMVCSSIVAQSTSHKDAVLGIDGLSSHRVYSTTNFANSGKLLYGTDTLYVNSAQIFDLGANNFSTNHYEYYLTLSDGIYNGGVEYIGGTYSITIELLSLGSSFTYGDFISCFFCGSSTAFSYVGHLFLIEDTNNDDQLDFNTDPFTDGDSGLVRINKPLDSTFLEIDFFMANGKRLEGCHVGEYPFDPLASLEDEIGGKALSLSVLGNPVKENLRFEFPAADQGEYYYTLCDSQGKQCLRGKLHEQLHTVDMSKVPRGTYFLNVIGEGEQSVWKKILVL